MKRRAFMPLIGGAAAWPLAACAQNPRTARIGYLSSIPSASADAALAEDLRDLGWNAETNISIERRVCSGDAQCLVKSAVELIELKVEVIVAEGAASTQVAKAAHRFRGNRRSGRSRLRGKLAHPGANLTDTSFDAGAEIPTRK